MRRPESVFATPGVVRVVTVNSIPLISSGAKAVIVIDTVTGGVIALSAVLSGRLSSTRTPIVVVIGLPNVPRTTPSPLSSATCAGPPIT